MNGEAVAWAVVAVLAVTCSAWLVNSGAGATAKPAPELELELGSRGAEPNPTPTPARRLSRRARISRIVCSVFVRSCAPALRVVACETGRTFDPRALGNAGERGLFQIHPVHFRAWPAWRARRLFEPRYNALFAYRLSRGGRDWSPWTCQP